MQFDAIQIVLLSVLFFEKCTSIGTPGRTIAAESCTESADVPKTLIYRLETLLVMMSCGSEAL